MNSWILKQRENRNSDFFIEITIFMLTNVAFMLLKIENPKDFAKRAAIYLKKSCYSFQERL